MLNFGRHCRATRIDRVSCPFGKMNGDPLEKLSYDGGQ